MSVVIRQHWRPVITAAAAALVVAALGGLSTVLDGWYYTLRKPSWQPPDWLFGPAWTLIFALAALSAVAFWRCEARREKRQRMLAAFALNGFLNLFWSLLFFRLRRPDLALMEVAALWLSIVLLIALAARASREAAWLLLPYLLWVSFAAYLNWTIVALNGSFSPHG